MLDRNSVRAAALKKPRSRAAATSSPTVYARAACEAKEQKIELASLSARGSTLGAAENSFLIDSALSEVDVSGAAGFPPIHRGRRRVGAAASGEGSGVRSTL